MSGLKRYGIKLGLERFRELARRAGNPQAALRCAHVGGTNGKGSTATMIACSLQQAGLRVGLYLSPYVHDLRERIQINGEMIPEERFADLAVRVRRLVEELEPTDYGQATEFEAKTLISLLYFAEERVDFASVEVGLGGRLDATNIITPVVSVITNVSMDHMEHLGGTLGQIAAEKAGIIKLRIPVVSAAESAEVCDVLRAAASRSNTSVTWVREAPDSGGTGGPQAGTVSWRAHPGRDAFDLASATRTLKDVRPALKGRFQAANAGCALGALDIVSGCGISLSDEHIRRGIETAWLPGRLQVVCREPLVFADGAHNPAAAQEVAAFLGERLGGRKLILVIGMMASHEPEKVLGVLGPLAECIYATETGEPGTHPAESIARVAESVCGHVVRQPDVKHALRQACRDAGKDGVVCVTGSFYLLGRLGGFVSE